MSTAEGAATMAVPVLSEARRLVVKIGAALRGLDPKALSTEELVKAALKNMMK